MAVTAAANPRLHRFGILRIFRQSWQPPPAGNLRIVGPARFGAAPSSAKIRLPAMRKLRPPLRSIASSSTAAHHICACSRRTASPLLQKLVFSTHTATGSATCLES